MHEKEEKETKNSLRLRQKIEILAILDRISLLIVLALAYNTEYTESVIIDVIMRL